MRTGRRNSLFISLMQGIVSFKGKSNPKGTKYPKSWKPKFSFFEKRAIAKAETKREREALVKKFRAEHYQKEQPLY